MAVPKKKVSKARRELCEVYSELRKKIGVH